MNVSSVSSTSVMSGSAVYASSKATGDHVTRNLAAEPGPLNFRVNAVTSGVTATDMGAPLQEKVAMLVAVRARTTALGIAARYCPRCKDAGGGRCGLGHGPDCASLGRTVSIISG